MRILLAKSLGLTRYLAEFNAQRQPKPTKDKDGNDVPGTPVPDITPGDFLLLLADRQLAGWADQYAPKIISADALRKRFTSDERRNIRAAAVAHPDTIGVLYDRLDSLTEVHLDPESDGGKELRAGLATLEGAGLLAPGRAAEIVAY